jgi:peptidyl-prolyl cis-trans isomerase B (cyclophilin B)
MPKSYPSAPPMSIDTAKRYEAKIRTSRGDIRITLFAQDAPITVNNFVFLAKDGFYDGLKFHRVITGFMIQGGCPNGDGRGGPGYRFEDETAGNPNVHGAGMLSMANAGPNTNGSQFFVTHTAQPHLNGKHTVFGQVIEGMDTVLAVRQGDEIQRVEIVEQPA